jgi:hypothetical protein
MFPTGMHAFRSALSAGLSSQFALSAMDASKIRKFAEIEFKIA